MSIPLIRLIGYVALAAVTSPIVGAYDYGTYIDGSRGLWSRLIISLVLAVIITVIGEAALRIARRLRRP